MDRPTTGKRRKRTGAVHVTELIGKQLAVFDLPDDTALVEILPADPAVEVDRTAHSRAINFAKIAALGMATVTLCGAVAAATMITRDRDAVTLPIGRQGGQITGERALLPDELNRAVAESRTGMPDPHTGTASATVNRNKQEPTRSTPVAGPARTGATSTQVSITERTPQPSTSTTVGKPTTPSKTQDRPVTSDRELVVEYYRLIESNPSLAYQLLSGDLLTTLDQFLGSWSSVRTVDVLTVEERADGVVAVVTMHLIGGGELRIKQLLMVTDTLPQRIIGAELLSAQSN